MNDDGNFFLQSMYLKAEEAVILFIHSSQTHESGQVVTLCTRSFSIHESKSSFF